MLWVHYGGVMGWSVGVGGVIYLILISIQNRTAKEIKASDRLFTAKLTNLPLYINHDDDATLHQFLNELYPHMILQVYITKRLDELQRMEQQLQRVEAKVFHYECQLAVGGIRGMVYKSRWMRACASGFDLIRMLIPSLPYHPSLDALEYYQAKADRLRADIAHRKLLPFASTGSPPLFILILPLLISPLLFYLSILVIICTQSYALINHHPHDHHAYHHAYHHHAYHQSCTMIMMMYVLS